MPDFFHMFIMARQLMGWNQSDVAEILGTTQAQISKIECLISQPSDKLLSLFAEQTRFYTSFFKQAGSIAVPTSVHPMYRKKEIKRSDPT